MRIAKIVLSFFFLLFVFNLSAQEIDSLAIDTIAIQEAEVLVDSTGKKIKVLKPGYPSPKKAMILSLALPGSGQIYNKDWWKLPLVYGALGGSIYLIDYNTDQYQRLREALILKRQNEEHEFTGTGIDNVNSLRTLRDEFDKNRQTAYVVAVFAYVLVAVEAFVDAHLKNFDIDDDLGLQLEPQIDFNSALGQPILGVGLSIPIGK